MYKCLYPARPDTSLSSRQQLLKPIEGQLWYNETNGHIYYFNGVEWIPLSNRYDYAANWGRAAHGELIPKPVSRDGYVFDYDECVWSTSPAVLGNFDKFICYADGDGLISCMYRPLGQNYFVDGVANYIIIGIRGNRNRGVYIPSSISVTGTPTISPTVTSTNPVTPSPTPTPTPNPTPSVSPSFNEEVLPLVVSISDPESFSDASKLLSFCNLTNYNPSNRDSGYANCSSSSVSVCPNFSCSPEPGDNLLGTVMRVTVSGGAAPYIVRIKNIQTNNIFDIMNSNFSDGDIGWNKGPGWTISPNDPNNNTFNYTAKFDGTHHNSSILNSNIVPVDAGRTVMASASIYVSNSHAAASPRIFVRWYNNLLQKIVDIYGNQVTSTGNWVDSTVISTPPLGAKYVSVGINASYATSTPLLTTVFVDDVKLNLGNHGQQECIFFGGAVVNSLPNPYTVKTYLINSPGGSTPIISLNGICSNNIFGMTGTFDIEVQDSQGQIWQTTKQWEIYRTETIETPQQNDSNN